jgi:hypothetical protein
VAGINGTDNEMTLTVPLDFLKGKYTATMFADSGSKDAPWRIETIQKLPKTVTCQPRGGFIFRVELQ